MNATAVSIKQASPSTSRLRKTRVMEQFVAGHTVLHAIFYCSGGEFLATNSQRHTALLCRWLHPVRITVADVIYTGNSGWHYTQISLESWRDCKCCFKLSKSLNWVANLRGFTVFIAADKYISNRYIIHRSCILIKLHIFLRWSWECSSASEQDSSQYCMLCWCC